MLFLSGRPVPGLRAFPSADVPFPAMAACRPPGDVPGHGERGTSRHSGLSAATMGSAEANANGRTRREGTHVKASWRAPHRILKG